MSLEDRLRRDLERAAERVPVSPDAWDRTRSRYARAQRSRRIALAVPVVAAVTALAVVVAQVRNVSDIADQPPAAEYFRGFWPESSMAEARAVQARVDAGDEPWRKAASSVVERFAREFIGWDVGPIDDEVNVAPGPDDMWTAEVSVAPRIGEGETRDGPVHVVRLVGLGDAAEPAWFVASIRSPNIVLDDPSDGAVASDPVLVMGTAVAFEGNVLTEVRDDAERVLHSGFVMAGGTEPAPFSADLDIADPSTDAGIVILRGSSGLEGPEPDWTVVRVRFSPEDADTRPVDAGEEAADGALRCFMQTRMYGDLDMGRACLTPAFADRLQASGGFVRPEVARFTVVEDLRREADLLEVRVRRYAGEWDDPLTTHALDTVTVVRGDSGWLVDDWTLGDDVTAGRVTTVKVFFVGPEVGDCDEGALIAVDRQVPATEDAARLVLDELFTGAWEGDTGVGNPVPLDSRVRSLGVADGTAALDVNGATQRGSASCSGMVRVAAIVSTLKQFGDIQRVDLTVDGSPVGFHDQELTGL